MRGTAGHTLVELLVAVAIVVVVLAGASLMFATAAHVANVSEATSSLLQETAVLERQLRTDLQRLCPQGFLAIRCAAVPNDVHGAGSLLHPALPPDAVIRADQLVFFTQGPASVQTYRAGAGSNRKGGGAASRIYYGHAFQIPQAPCVVSADEDGDGDIDVAWAIDPQEPMVPWSAGGHALVKTRFQNNATDPPGDYRIDGTVGVIKVTPPPATRWLLARQATVLADDGGSPAVFLFNLQEGGFRSTAAIDDAAIRHGRVDAAASRLGDIRAAVLAVDRDRGPDAWSEQRQRLAGAVFYPRAERAAPGPHRVDQALTNHVLSVGCSSFVVDWTFRDGIGEAIGYRGIRIEGAQTQPWFGLDPCGDPSTGRGVMPLTEYLGSRPLDRRPETIRPEVIERYGPPDTAAGMAIQETGTVVYEALFGYNRDRPLDPTTGAPWAASKAAAVVYTPFPSAIRITIVLHDARGRPEGGRTVQFVLDVPER